MTFNTSSLVCLLALTAAACGSPAVPFDTLKNASVTAYRLHPVPPPPPAAAPQPGALPTIPGLPPEIQQWAQQAAPALQQMLPPGLLPPGLIPGLPQQPAPAAQNPMDQAPRFHNFPIVQSMPLMSEDLKEELAEILGYEDNFDGRRFNCMYAEFGISFSTTPGAPPNDILLSMSCNQVQAHNFVWPHPQTGLTPETVKALSELLPKLFPNTGAPMASAPSPTLVLL